MTDAPSSSRIELPDGTTADWLLSTLPKGVKEGDMLLISGEGGDFDLEIDHAETQRRRQQGQTKLEALNQTAPDGEMTL
ncbi:DUF3006 domain-containing protein [Deinococcus wulumuqiensis]|uniref:DUF3006 domain-containing protein n=1 Tax=Deinococcus wulumuqiensis TaxID=980427 RepID=UPI0024326109|nr:DUF3006 domain-containing protein [Deinococcus wulumuqiensis]